MLFTIEYLLDIVLIYNIRNFFSLCQGQVVSSPRLDQKFNYDKKVLQKFSGKYPHNENDSQHKPRESHARNWIDVSTGRKRGKSKRYFAPSTDERLSPPRTQLKLYPGYYRRSSGHLHYSRWKQYKDTIPTGAVSRQSRRVSSESPPPSGADQCYVVIRCKA